MQNDKSHKSRPVRQSCDSAVFAFPPASGVHDIPAGDGGLQYGGSQPAQSFLFGLALVRNMPGICGLGQLIASYFHEDLQALGSLDYLEWIWLCTLQN